VRKETTQESTANFPWMDIGFSTLVWVHTVTLPRTATPYRDSADETRDRLTYQKLVTR